MSERRLAEIICAALLAIVAGIRKKYDLPVYHGVTVIMQPVTDPQEKEVVIIK